MLLSHGSLDIIGKRVCLHHLLDPSIVLWLLLLAMLSLTIVRSGVEMYFGLFELLGASSDLVENVCVQMRCRRHGLSSRHNLLRLHHHLLVLISALQTWNKVT